MTDFAPMFSTDRKMTSLERFGLSLRGSVVKLATRWRHRREIRQLTEFDDHMLKDIGLTRSEVEGALAEPFFNDRAVFLVRWNERQLRLDKVKSSVRGRPTVPVVVASECCA